MKKNTRELKIGTTFLLYGLRRKLIAQGPEIFVWLPINSDIASGNATICPHMDVWIDVPRTKVGEFKIGDRFKLPGGVYVVTAVGREYSLAVNTNGKGHEIAFEHCHIVEEAPDEVYA